MWVGTAKKGTTRSKEDATNDPPPSGASAQGQAPNRQDRAEGLPPFDPPCWACLPQQLTYAIWSAQERPDQAVCVLELCVD